MIGNAANSEMSYLVKTRAQTLRLSPAASLVLDIARFTAALAVAIGHFSLPMYSLAIPNMMVPASGAVGVFFVLSGFVIRYVTNSRLSTLGEYLLDRASRLFSVLVPAICFTVVVDLIVRHQTKQPITEIGDYIVRLVTTVTFTSEVWFQDLAPVLNHPFWSLSYEAFYYVFYGLAFYLRGPKRWVLFGVGCLMAGPSILFLAPVWFFGVLLQDFYQKIHRSMRQSITTAGVLGVIGVTCTGYLHSLPHDKRYALSVTGKHFASQMQAWHMQQASSWYWEAGIPSGIAILCALLLLNRVPIPPKSRLIRMVRFGADGTFSLYLFHLPMIILVRALIPYNPSSRLQLAAVFVSVVTVCILLERPCLKLKNLIRARFSSMMERRQPPKMTMT